MPFNADRFLRLAEYLIEDSGFGDREALNRAAVGRLYYGMFLKIRDYVRNRGTRASTFGSLHGVLLSDSDLALVGYDIDQLHALRNKCDYDDSNEFVTEDVERALRLIERIQAAMAPHW